MLLLLDCDVKPRPMRPFRAKAASNLSASADSNGAASIAQQAVEEQGAGVNGTVERQLRPEDECGLEGWSDGAWRLQAASLRTPYTLF